MKPPMNVSIEIHKARRDHRGISFEFLGGVDASRWVSAHAALTFDDAVRGNHLHPSADELLFVAGPALVRIAVAGEEVRDIEIAEDEVARFLIPAGVAHAVKGRGAGSLLVSFSSESAPATVSFALL